MSDYVEAHDGNSGLRSPQSIVFVIRFLLCRKDGSAGGNELLNFRSNGCDGTCNER
jgi:hypothetical protein